MAYPRTLHGTTKLKNPVVPLEQRDGDSPKFKENSSHFKVRSLTLPEATENALAMNFQNPALHLFGETGFLCALNHGGHLFP